LKTFTDHYRHSTRSSSNTSSSCHHQRSCAYPRTGSRGVLCAHNDWQRYDGGIHRTRTARQQRGEDDPQVRRVERRTRSCAGSLCAVPPDLCVCNPARSIEVRSGWSKGTAFNLGKESQKVSRGDEKAEYKSVDLLAVADRSNLCLKRLQGLPIKFVRKSRDGLKAAVSCGKAYRDRQYHSYNYFIIMLHPPGCSCSTFFSTVAVHLRPLNTSSAYSDRAYHTARTVHTAHYRYNYNLLRSPGCRKPGCNVCRRAWRRVCASSNGPGRIRRRYSSPGVSSRKGSLSGRLGT
jgi:hypothetical protein